MAWIETSFPKLNSFLNEIKKCIKQDLIKESSDAHATLIYDCGENVDAIGKKFQNLSKMKMKIVDIRIGNISPVLLLVCECEELEDLFWDFYEDNETNGTKQHNLIEGYGKKRTIDNKGFIMHITICWFNDKECMLNSSIKKFLDKKSEFLKTFNQEIEISEFTWFSEDESRSKTFFLK